MDLRIEAIKSQDATLLNDCFSLFNRTQGKGIISLDYIKRAIDDPSRRLFTVHANDTLVGAAVVQILAADDFEYHLPLNEVRIRELFKSHRVGSLSASSVVEAFQGQGIGKALAQKRIEWLLQEKCDAVISVSWESGLSNNSSNVFKNLAFELWGRDDRFYVQDSMTRPFYCVVCGDPPCKCAALLFVLDSASKMQKALRL